MAARVHNCSTCQATFSTLEAVREHYNSEIHLKNVRKRVGAGGAMSDVTSSKGTPSIAPSQRVGGLPGTNTSTVASAMRYFCSVCNKHFRSVQTLQDHVKSKQHKDMKEAAQEEKKQQEAGEQQTDTAAAEEEENDKTLKFSTDDTIELTEKHCLFCSTLFESVSQNLQHMSREHSFLVPQLPHCKDLEGLLSYLSRKVNGCVCFVCGDNSKDFESLAAVRMHMLDRRHHNIILDEEYSAFYDDVVFLPVEDAASRTAVATRDGRTLVRRGDVLHTDPVCRSLMIAPKHASGTGSGQLIHKTHDMNPAVVAARAAENKKQIQAARRDVIAQTKYWTTVGVQGNKLHPKGYDGEA